MEFDELKDCSYKPSKITREEEIEKASKEFAYNVSSIRPELNADRDTIVEPKSVEEFVSVAESPLKTFPRVNEFETGASYRR